MKKTILFSFSLLLLVACGGSDKSCKDCDKPKEKEKDTIVDPLKEAMKKDTAVTDTKERSENHAKIVKKYGEQWDFCKCVIANDSINDAAERGIKPKDEAKFMARWDEVEKKCKELTTYDQTTPDERMKYEKRVNKCLKDAGIKK